MPKHLTALLGITAAVVLGIALIPLSIQRPASAAAGDVFITHVDCDSNPEVIRIKNFGSSSQSLGGFHLQSDPSQDYTLTDFVASIGAGATIEFQAGSNASDGANRYKLTGSFILRNDDPTDYARLVRPGASNNQVNCGSTPVTPPPATPTPTTQPTATPPPTSTGTPTPTPPPDTHANSPGYSSAWRS